MSANAIEREHGVKRDQVLQWVERFNTGGVDSLRRRPQRTYTPELMLEVVQAYLAGGTSYPQLARRYNILITQLSSSGSSGILVVNRSKPLGGLPG